MFTLDFHRTSELIWLNKKPLFVSTLRNIALAVGEVCSNNKFPKTISRAALKK